MAGLPKFCLPISESRTLLHWHVAAMLEVCDEVRVCTRAIWAPLVEVLELPVTLYVKEPSTMSDALAYMAGSGDDTFIIGMPDTMVVPSDGNFYREMRHVADADASVDVVLAAFACGAELRGKVGQIELAPDGTLLRSVDKDPASTFEHMWGGMLLRNRVMKTLDRGMPTPGLQFQQWLDKGFRVRAALCAGEYVDVGSSMTLRELYRKL